MINNYSKIFSMLLSLSAKDKEIIIDEIEESVKNNNVTYSDLIDNLSSERKSDVTSIVSSIDTLTDKIDELIKTIKERECK